ncbi:hypothetical protein [Streptomyces sp. PT12]|uniref:hypothetical protein n=1 Tax=Streptomyces sp. PT12 TaxID=1510197 RepID=UPI0015EF9873|nr:hypothetical protein [Streptomyces sp. PT12]
MIRSATVPVSTGPSGESGTGGIEDLAWASASPAICMALPVTDAYLLSIADSRRK